MMQHDDTASLRHMLDHAKEVIFSSLLSSQNPKISWIQNNATSIPLPCPAIAAAATEAMSNGSKGCLLSPPSFHYPPFTIHNLD